VNTVTASFNTIMTQMTEMSRRRKHIPECRQPLGIFMEGPSRVVETSLQTVIRWSLEKNRRVCVFLFNISSACASFN